MKSKAFKIIVLITLFNFYFGYSQNIIKIKVLTIDNEFIDDPVEVYSKETGYITTINIGEFSEINVDDNPLSLIFISINHPVIEKAINPISTDEIIVELPSRTQNLSEVVVNARKKRVFELRRLKDFEGTSIYSGKKTEVISLNESMANLATNNARQIYSQVVGLNIFQNDDAGLQLNIGGRGLDPNRTSNFNTRQNGYDISADVLGYPESYYSPPAEAIEEIQILRGAASLQYGTQFGGLVNFIMKSSNIYKPLEIITRNTAGSNGLYTNFTSLSLNKGKNKIYSFINYKSGDGFRDNSEFDSFNLFFKNEYEISEKTQLSAEITYLKYLAKQGGGLTDIMFNENPFQSNRSRNWFQIDWFLYNLSFKHNFSKNTILSANFFGLNAKRNALGFRTNRVSQVDSFNERDLIKGDFNNYGTEIRFLKKYDIFKKNATWVVGVKYYNSNTSAVQGPGSIGSDADFDIKTKEFPYYNFQSNYRYPNKNIALFAENIFYLNDKLSITPGFRYEYIKTESNGSYKKTNRDAAGNVIFDETIENNEIRKRNFILLGLGGSYKYSTDLEIYLNISENYRSVTFADISIFNPAYAINPNISDENGFTLDMGFRGLISDYLSYDMSTFLLSYNNRIGFVQRAFQDGSVKTERGNVGDASIIGIETLVDLNLKKLFLKNNPNHSFNYFLNFSLINSKYTRSEEPGVEGKMVEYVPSLNLKTGSKYGYKNFMINFQYTYLSDQFTDSSNAIESNLSGVIGVIPSYDVFDLSVSYSLKRIKIESGFNNLFNNKYFSRRATGYPGPGIIPSAPRTFYFTIQYKI
ncbi:MAG: TonB-dependent receptor [Flavobacteriaceae bacterium]|nr:TonB-dependent receptor [Flavobacteriaceae bacterium]|tara:strand:- start:7954 stop:10386 length:2433 start_codon:yes stop_codon:yes gene_type:complete